MKTSMARARDSPWRHAVVSLACPRRRPPMYGPLARRRCIGHLALVAMHCSALPAVRSLEQIEALPGGRCRGVAWRLGHLRAGLAGFNLCSLGKVGRASTRPRVVDAGRELCRR